MDTIDRAIINRLQESFPLCKEPYRAVAEELNITDVELLQRLQALLTDKTLTRFGPMYHAGKLGGAFTLAAMAVPQAQFDHVASIVNEFPQVAHNYERDHRFNMWFVVATATPDEIDTTLEAIETASGYRVFNMPKQEEFYVGLHLPA